MKLHQISRQELYDLVWNEPYQKVADVLNLTEFLLKVTCSYSLIPMPLRSDSNADDTEPKTIQELPTTTLSAEQRIDVKGLYEHFNDHYQKYVHQRSREIFQSHPSHCKVESKLLNPSPVVRRAKSILAKERAGNWRGFEDVITNRNSGLSVCLSKSQLQRMLLFIDSFIKLTEKRGHKFNTGSDNSITMFGINEKIIFREKATRKKKSDSRWLSFHLVPNGKLSVKIAKPNSTTEWVEGKKSLGEMLPDIMAGLELYFEKKKLYKTVLEKGWEEQRERRRREKEKLARAEFEAKKVDVLLAHFKKWSKSNEMMDFIDEVGTRYTHSEALSNWTSWARREAERINPLSGSDTEFFGLYEYREEKE